MNEQKNKSSEQLREERGGNWVNLIFLLLIVCAIVFVACIVSRKKDEKENEVTGYNKYKNTIGSEGA